MIENLARGWSEGDLELFRAQVHEDSVMEYAQSGERIVGGEDGRAVYGWAQPFEAAHWRSQRVERMD